MSEVPLYMYRGTFLLRNAHPLRITVQGYVAHKKPLPPRTLQYAYSLSPVMVLEGGALSYE